ncbi:MgtC/SapB family protein [Butyrivibrio sp. JL13D10]|uniref:MgtC/SapB family protein n=1 Tax=Butyrivibrio sp. JL13D10 TaxID=3236815 RepID=UPI0038B590AC
MMDNMIQFLEGTNDIAVVLRLFIATILGSLVGWERIARHHNAGIKTFALVSLGSAVAAALNVYFAMMPGLNADVSRIPAGVVSGIGFLGAGTILVTGRKQIRGLSTAASLWVTACMGMAIGGGYLVVGVAGFLLIAFTNLVLMHFSKRVEAHSQFISLYVEINKNHGVNKLNKYLNEQGFTVITMNKSKEKTIMDSDTALIIELELDKKRSHIEIIQLLTGLDYINYVEEI